MIYHDKRKKVPQSDIAAHILCCPIIITPYPEPRRSDVRQTATLPPVRKEHRCRSLENLSSAIAGCRLQKSGGYKNKCRKKWCIFLIFLIIASKESGANRNRGFPVFARTFPTRTAPPFRFSIREPAALIVMKLKC